MRIANRMRNIDSSGIRKVFDLARKMENPINLSIGQPDFKPPEQIVNKAIEAMREGHNRYTSTEGIEDLREDVGEYLKKRKGFEPEKLMITSGVAGGLMLAYLVLLNPGDEVIIPDPYFVIYKHLCNLVMAVPRFVDTYPDFMFTAERMERLITARTKLIVLNNPSNPTGALLPAERVEEIARLADERGITVLSDEIYDFFTYDGEHESAGRYSAGALVLGGFSKSFGVPGWRVGYAAGPAAIIDEMAKLQQYSFVCAPSVLQHGLTGAFEIDMKGYLEGYRNKRDRLCRALEGRYNFVKPGGAFYLFPEAPDKDGEGFVQRAIEKNLLIVPGSVFSERDTHFRISFAASDETISRGIEVLNSLA